MTDWLAWATDAVQADSGWMTDMMKCKAWVMDYVAMIEISQPAIEKECCSVKHSHQAACTF